LPDIVEPNLFAIRRVQEWHAEPSLILFAAVNGAGITLSLREDTLGSEGQLLGLDDSQKLSLVREHIVSRAKVGLIFLDGEGSFTWT
jgi:hypothetical protein